MSYKLFLHCDAAVSKILTDTSRGPSAVAELLVYSNKNVKLMGLSEKVKAYLQVKHVIGHLSINIDGVISSLFPCLLHTADVETTKVDSSDTSAV